MLTSPASLIVMAHFSYGIAVYVRLELHVHVHVYGQFVMPYYYVFTVLKNWKDP